MKITNETKFVIGVILSSIAIVTIALLFFFRPVKSLTRANLLPEGTVTKGPEEAKIYLVEFSDFQCPACREFQPVVDKLLDKYKGRIIFGYRHFPLPRHAFAFKAAEAAEAAGEQGKFWVMYTYLFAHQEQLSDEFIKNSGKAIGLDQEKFQMALKKGKYSDKIRKDMSDGNKFGVNSTPTFFLNGKQLILTTFDDLDKAIEEVLNKE